MRVAALRVELHIPAPQSLKEKRAILRPIIEGLRGLGSYSVAEVGHHDAWQRSSLGIAIVAPDGSGLARQIAKVHRYLDTRLDAEVIDIFRTEMEVPE